MRRHLRWAVVAAAVVVAGAVSRAQPRPTLEQELRRIFETNDYAARTFGPAVWFDEGGAYGVVERTDGIRVLVAYDAATGRREVLADAALLTPKGAAAPLEVSGYSWSPDRKRSGDDNVHYQGTERLANKLVELGKPLDFLVYPNRSHGISEGAGTSLHVHSLIARYFLDHLTPGPKAAAVTPQP